MSAKWTLQMQHGYRRTKQGVRAAEWVLLRIYADGSVETVSRLSCKTAEALKAVLPYGD